VKKGFRTNVTRELLSILPPKSRRDSFDADEVVENPIKVGIQDALLKETDFVAGNTLGSQPFFGRHGSTRRKKLVRGCRQEAGRPPQRRRAP
jgi:hypothetical protein